MARKVETGGGKTAWITGVEPEIDLQKAEEYLYCTLLTVRALTHVVTNTLNQVRGALAASDLMTGQEDE